MKHSVFSKGQKQNNFWKINIDLFFPETRFLFTSDSSEVILFDETAAKRKEMLKKYKTPKIIRKLKDKVAPREQWHKELELVSKYHS